MGVCRALVAALNDQGIMVDVSHVGPRTTADVIEASRAPVIASHSTAQAVYDNPRGLTVFVLREIEGLSTAEAATLLTIRSETVKTRLHRARRLLRLTIERMLSAGFSEIFPFDGARCVHMADRVVECLRESQEGRKVG